LRIVAVTSNVSPTLGVVGVCVAFVTTIDDCALAGGAVAARLPSRQSVTNAVTAAVEGCFGDMGLV
jgi:hypothetical protein